MILIVRMVRSAENITKVIIAVSVLRLSYKGERDARQPFATLERIIADARDTIGNDYARQTIAIVERVIADTRSTCDDDRFQA